MWGSVCSSVNMEHIITVPAYSVFVRIWSDNGIKHSETAPVVITTAYNTAYNNSCHMVDVDQMLFA